MSKITNILIGILIDGIERGNVIQMLQSQPKTLLHIGLDLPRVTQVDFIRVEIQASHPSEILLQEIFEIVYAHVETLQAAKFSEQHCLY